MWHHIAIPLCDTLIQKRLHLAHLQSTIAQRASLTVNAIRITLREQMGLAGGCATPTPPPAASPNLPDAHGLDNTR